MTPQNSPTKNPPATSFNVCWRTMMRAEPSMPASRMKAQSHPVGLNMEDKAVREQSAYHHAAACRMGADFPLDVDKCADDHAEQGGYG